MLSISGFKFKDDIIPNSTLVTANILAIVLVALTYYLGLVIEDYDKIYIASIVSIFTIPVALYGNLVFRLVILLPNMLALGVVGLYGVAIIVSLITDPSSKESPLTGVGFLTIALVHLLNCSLAFRDDIYIFIQTRKNNQSNQPSEESLIIV